MSKVRIGDAAAYAAVRLVEVLVESVPASLALAAARTMGWIAYHADRRHRSRAFANVEKAYAGTLSRQEVKRIVCGAFQHMFLVGAEVRRFRRLARSGRSKGHIRWIGRQHVAEALAKGKGAIFVTGHIGNWELSSRMLTIEGFPITVVARPMDNPLLEAHLLSVRSEGGQTVISKEGALLSIARAARAGRMLGFVADQSAGHDGVFVDFFGRPASTVKSVAALSLKFGMPIVTGACCREGVMKFVAHADPPIFPEPSGDSDADILRITQTFTSNLEAHIRAHPDQWLWLHRRWRYRPDGTKEP